MASQGCAGRSCSNPLEDGAGNLGAQGALSARSVGSGPLVVQLWALFLPLLSLAAWQLSKPLFPLLLYRALSMSLSCLLEGSSPRRGCPEPHSPRLDGQDTLPASPTCGIVQTLPPWGPGVHWC